jgi:hypothetical protein
LAEHSAVGLGEAETIGAAFLLLALVVGAHPVSGLLQRLTTLWTKRFKCRLQLVAWNFERANAAGSESIKLIGVVKYRGVTTRFDFGKYAGHRSFNRRIFGGFEREHGHQRGAEICIGGVESSDLD